MQYFYLNVIIKPFMNGTKKKVVLTSKKGEKILNPHLLALVLLELPKRKQKVSPLPYFLVIKNKKIIIFLS